MTLLRRLLAWLERRRQRRMRAVFALGRASMHANADIRNTAVSAFDAALSGNTAHAWLGGRCRLCGLDVHEATSTTCVPSEPR